MSSIGMLSRLARSLVSLAVVAAVASCGGGGDGGGTTNPPGVVARVEITANSTNLQVGQTTQATVRYFDASSSQLGGRTVEYSTSDANVATVNTTGLITAAAPGPVTISATVDGIVGNLSVTVSPVPVAFIAITPANPTIRVGETVALTAQPQNASGQPLNGRTVNWSSANVTRATVNAAGTVTGVAAGNVYIRATVDNRTDSVSVRVRNLVSPTITGTPSSILVPDGPGGITGANFGATIGDNELLVNGVAATITAASTTSITFTVPSKSKLPCSATGPVPIALIVAGDTATSTVQLRVATERTLAVGEYHLFATEADLLCNEYTGNGGKYIITAFNYANSATTQTSFKLTGAATSGTTTLAIATAAQSYLAPRPPAWTFSEDRMTRHLRAHTLIRDADQQLLARLGNPRLRERAALRRAQSGIASVALAQNPPPAVGDIVPYRVRRTITSAATFDEVNFRVVYSGTKIIILEDPASPMANQMDVEYQKIGEEYDRDMYDQLLNFGDPLVIDSLLDNNGRMLALFTPKVNNYVVGGQSNTILGFVQLCDFFSRVDCPASNVGEAFYALIPDPAAGWSISLWRRLIRGTLVHETKHILSYAYRLALGAEFLEERWLDESTAQQASEIWARGMYNRAQRQDIGWGDGPLCDYAAPGGGCPDPAEGILHHMGFMYDHYISPETKSIIDNNDDVYYGSTWSFMRYLTDTYGMSETAFLSSIIQTTDLGVMNVTSKTGRPFSELLGMFALASAADNYPNTNLTDPKLRLASWNTRDLYANMSENLERNDGSPAYPLPWPLQYRSVTFGNFNTAQSDVSQLKGGGFALWELSGTQSGPQALAIRSTTGGAPPPSIGMAIVRIQ